jgi:hypothetical protein
MTLNIGQIRDYLGTQATLLDHRCKTVSAESLHLPGPDYIDRVMLDSDRTPAVLNALQRMFNTGRLGGTGYLSILPVDQGIEHSAAASFAPNPAMFDPENIVKLALEGVDAATYKYVVRGVRFLSRSGEIKIGADVEEVQAEMGLMRTGDCNGDNVINIRDFSILKNSFGKADGDEGYDARAELTGDGVVNIRDFSLLRGNFGIAGDE